MTVSIFKKAILVLLVKLKSVALGFPFAIHTEWKVLLENMVD